MHLKSGTLLKRGDYRIINSLGRGGFGITYLAEQVNLHRRVCIKEFFPKDYYKREGDTGALTLSSEGFAESMNRFKAKFIKEAQTIATLNHANIIPIYDIFEENSTAYYVMEYIDGVSLSSIVKKSGALSEDVAVDYIRQIASALEHIHERKINHLDVKPGNIMVRRNDNRAILIDFGLSKHYDATSGEATSTTPVGVSHGYAPMEQYKQGGVNKFSPETDIYSLGATLYYLVTGSTPPQAADIPEVGISFPAHISSNIRETIEKSMSYWRKDRPHTIKEFLALLDGGAPKRAVADNSTVISAAASDDEKTKIVTPQPTPQPKIERPKSKTPIEPKSKQKRSLWWLWLLGLLLIGDGAWFVIGNNKGEKTEEVVLPDTSAPYQVGDLYNENGKQGVVFEVTDDGRHGKIVSLDETKTQWDSRVRINMLSWSKSDLINGTKTGANNKSDGKENTDNVMQRSDSDQYPAFIWCRNKGADWYLPAKDELVAIFNNQSAINSTLAEYNAEQIEGWYYWSSTEYDDDPKFCAWGVRMGNGLTNDEYKCYDDYVRAVSAF